jgi:hypothetical protein
MLVLLAFFVKEALTLFVLGRAFSSLCHGYSFCRAYLRAYSTSFAVFQVYLDGYGFLDDSIWAVKPAEKA